MSRRSRQRGGRRAQGWLGKLALGLIVAGVLAAGLLYAVVRGFLYSDGFRQLLSGRASAAAQVEGQFSRLRWDGLAVDSSVFEASGQGVVKQVRLDGLHTEIGLGGLGRGVWEIRGSRVQRMEVALDVRQAGGVVPPLDVVDRVPGRGISAGSSRCGWLPQEFELQGVDVGEVVVKVLLDQGGASLSGMKLRVDPVGSKHAYRADASDGTMHLPLSGVPDVHLVRSKLRFQDGQGFLTSFDATVWQDGQFTASGEWNVVARSYALEGNLTGVKCADLFSEDWSQRCSGEMKSDFTLDNHRGWPVARGHLTVSNGVLTALPVLESLAAYADTRRFRILVLSEAHADWRLENGECHLTNLVLASEGLVRIEGSLVIRGNTLDGRFLLGLAPGTLARIPGAETDVFVAGARGLVWAPLRLTGTLDHPSEDMTDRLVAAAGLRMFENMPETGEKVIKFTRSLLGDDSPKAVEQELENLKARSKTVRKLSGLLDGLLGGAPPPEPEPAPAAGSATH